MPSPLTSATVMPTGLSPAKKLLGGLEGAVGVAEEDEDVVAAAVGHDQVLDAVAVEVGQHDGAGAEDRLGLWAWPGSSAAHCCRIAR